MAVEKSLERRIALLRVRTIGFMIKFNVDQFGNQYRGCWELECITDRWHRFAADTLEELVAKAEDSVRMPISIPADLLTRMDSIFELAELHGLSCHISPRGREYVGGVKTPGGVRTVVGSITEVVDVLEQSLQINGYGEVPKTDGEAPSLEMLFKRMESVSMDAQRDVDLWYCHQKGQWNSNVAKDYAPLESIVKETTESLLSHKR